MKFGSWEAKRLLTRSIEIKEGEKSWPFCCFETLIYKKFNFPLSFNTRSKSREWARFKPRPLWRKQQKGFEKVWNVFTQKKRFGGSITHLFIGLILCALHLHVILRARQKFHPGNYPVNTLTTPRAMHPSPSPLPVTSWREAVTMTWSFRCCFSFWNCCNQLKDV